MNYIPPTDPTTNYLDQFSTTSPQPSKLKVNGIAIATIVLIGGFIGLGIAGCVGAITTITKIEAIFVMATSGLSGALVITGLIAYNLLLCKNQPDKRSNDDDLLHPVKNPSSQFK